MRRVAVLVLLVGLAVSGAEAQSLSGSVSGAFAGSWRTNTYLSEYLSIWQEPSRRGGLDLRPQARMTLRTDRSAATIAGSGYASWPTWGPRRIGAGSGETAVWSGRLHLSRRIATSWGLGLSGGLQEARMDADRRSGWIMPYVRWHPGGRWSLSLQGGGSALNVEDSYGLTRRYRSWVGLARTSWWPAARWRVQASTYWSDSDPSARAPGYRGTGGRIAVRYLGGRRWTIDVEAGLERTGYQLSRSDRIAGRDDPRRFLGKAGVRLDRRLGDRVELFADTRLLAVERAGTNASTDWHGQVRAGVRVELQGTFWQRDRRPRNQWQLEDGRLRLEVAYEGPGRPYLTGTFNRWAEPGRPLRRTDRGTYAATVDLPSGRHEFAVRVEGDEDRQWLELPEGLPTVSDGFGRTNGVLVVRERSGPCNDSRLRSSTGCSGEG